MGGIAAEAVEYDKAEGGASDEETLVQFLVGLIPPWDQKRVLNQARWAVTQVLPTPRMVTLGTLNRTVI